MISNITCIARRVSLAAAAGLMAIASTPAPAADDSLYLELGGREGIDRIVELHVAKLIADDRIRANFDNTNMERFGKLAADHLCVVAGGPCTYTGRPLGEAHRGLHLKNSDFNAVTEDLEAAMDQAGVPYRTQNRLLARLAPKQHEVVTR